jgi:hypothetical protein
MAHAWLALMALQRLKSAPKKTTGWLGGKLRGFYLGSSFDVHFNEQAAAFSSFFDDHKDSFLQGAWFPDSVIADNLTGGHTFKMRWPKTAAEEKSAVAVTGRLPAHLSSLRAVGIPAARLQEKVCYDDKFTLPDRCEALGYALRDMILIQNDLPKGADVMFNDQHLALYFLMLSHYLADSHVPPHCDARDFYGPSTVHPDMEEYWDDEVKRFFAFDKERRAFDYDLDGAPELAEDDKTRAEFEGSLLYRVAVELAGRKWPLKKTAKGVAGEDVLGKGNKELYDYVKSVNFASYLLSTDFIPKDVPENEYKGAKFLIRELPEYREKMEKLSVHVLADTIDSIALGWILTWDSYKKLKEGKETKKADIKKEGNVSAGAKAKKKTGEK